MLITPPPNADPVTYPAPHNEAPADDPRPPQPAQRDPEPNTPPQRDPPPPTEPDAPGPPRVEDPAPT